MTATNGGRPLPWHDTPLCRKSDADFPGAVCGCHMACGETKPVIRCSACGTGRRGSEAEWAQAKRADDAFQLHLAEEVWPDRGCEKCNAALMLDRVRLCGPCVEKDNRERQHELAL